MNYNPPMTLQSLNDFIDLFQKQEKFACSLENQKLNQLNTGHIQNINQLVTALRSMQQQQVNYNFNTEDGHTYMRDFIKPYIDSSINEQEKKFIHECIYGEYGFTEYLMKFIDGLKTIYKKDFNFIADFLEIIIERYGVDVNRKPTSNPQ